MTMINMITTKIPRIRLLT